MPHAEVSLHGKIGLFQDGRRLVERKLALRERKESPNSQSPLQLDMFQGEL
jgi:hypothetical protein